MEMEYSIVIHQDVQQNNKQSCQFVKRQNKNTTCKRLYGHEK